MCAYFVSVRAEWDFKTFLNSSFRVMKLCQDVCVTVQEKSNSGTLNYWTGIVTHCRDFCSPLDGPPGPWGPSAKLLSSWVVSSISWCRNFYLPLLNLMRLLSTQLSSLLQSLWIAAWLLVCQSCTMSKLVEITLFPIIQISKDDNKEDHTQYWLSVCTGDTSN